MIEGKKVILRIFRESDLDEYFSLTSNIKEKGDYYPTRILSEIEFRNKFRESGWWESDLGRMLITDKKERLIGEISFFTFDKHIVGYEIGYQIFRNSDRGKGYTSEALALFSSYIFDHKDTPRLRVMILKGNTASIKVAEKCGYIHDGTLRKACFNRGEYHDLEMFSMLREECPKLKDLLK